MNKKNIGFFKYLLSNRYTFFTSLIFLLIALIFSSAASFISIQAREEIDVNTSYLKDDSFVLFSSIYLYDDKFFEDLKNEIKEIKEIKHFYSDGYYAYVDYSLQGNDIPVSLFTLSDFTQVSWIDNYTFLNDNYTGYIVTENYARYKFPNLKLEEIIGKTIYSRDDFEIKVSNICSLVEYKGHYEEMIVNSLVISSCDFKVFSLINEKEEIHKKVFGDDYFMNRYSEIVLNEKNTEKIEDMVVTYFSGIYSHGSSKSKINIVNASYRAIKSLSFLFYTIGIVVIFFSTFINCFLYYLFLVKKEKDTKLRLLLGARKNDVMILSTKYILFLSLIGAIISIFIVTIFLLVMCLSIGFVTLKMILIPLCVLLGVLLIHLFFEFIISLIYSKKKSNYLN